MSQPNIWMQRIQVNPGHTIRSIMAIVRRHDANMTKVAEEMELSYQTLYRTVLKNPELVEKLNAYRDKLREQKKPLRGYHSS